MPLNEKPKMCLFWFLSLLVIEWVILSKVGVTAINTCEIGQYWDAGQAKCLQCDASCGTCNQAGKCLSCKDALYFYLAADDTCKRCATGYLDVKDNQCKACSVSCGNKCIDSTPNGCLNCPTGKKLDIVTLTCVDTCPTNTGDLVLKNHSFFGGVDVPYCRNREIYLDSSNTGLQLGTKKYPYSEIISGYHELYYNEPWFLPGGKLFFKENKVFYKYQDYHILFNISTTLTSYSNANPSSPGRAKIEAQHQLPPTAKREAEYLAWYGYNHPISKYERMGTDPFVELINSDFIIYNEGGSLTVKNIDIFYSQAPPQSFLPHIFLSGNTYDGGYGIWEDVNVETTVTFMTAFTPLNLTMKRVSIKILQPILQLWAIGSNGGCTVIPLSTFLLEDFSVSGGVVLTTMFQVATRGNMIFKNITIDNVVGYSSTYFQFKELNLFCHGKMPTNAVLDNHNTIDGVVIKNVLGPAGGIEINTLESQKVPRKVTITISNLLYKNIAGYGKKLDILTNVDPTMQVVFTNVTFDNVTQQDNNSLPVLDMKQIDIPLITFVNLKILNCNFLSPFIRHDFIPIKFINLFINNSNFVNLNPSNQETPFMQFKTAQVDFINFTMVATVFKFRSFIDFQGSQLNVMGLGLVNVAIIERVKSIFLFKESSPKFNITGYQCFNTVPLITPQEKAYLIDIQPNQHVQGSLEQFQTQCSNLQLASVNLVRASYKKQAQNTTLLFKTGEIKNLELLPNSFMVYGSDSSSKNINSIVMEAVKTTNVTLRTSANLLLVEGTLDFTIQGCEFSNIISPNSSVIKVTANGIMSAVNPLQFKVLLALFSSQQVQHAIELFETVDVLVYNVTFMGINGTYGSVLSAQGESSRQIVFKNVTITQIRASETGGVFKITEKNMLVLDNVTSINNFGPNAPFAQLIATSLQVQNSTFIQHYSTKGAALMILELCRQDVVSLIQTSMIKGNSLETLDQTGNSQGVIMAIECKFQMQNLLFDHQEYGINLKTESELSFTGLQVVTLTPLHFPLIFCHSSKVTLGGMNQTLNQSKDSPHPLLSVQSNSEVHLASIEIHNSTLNTFCQITQSKRVSSFTGIAIKSVEVRMNLFQIDSVTNLVASQLGFIRVSHKGTSFPFLFHLQKSSMSISFSVFMATLNLNLIFGKEQTLSVSKSNFTSITYTQDAYQQKLLSQKSTTSGIQCDFCKLTLNEVRVVGANGSHSGGFVRMTPHTFRTYKPTATIHKCFFQGVKSTDLGGAVYLNNVNMNMSESEFVGNQAGTHGGGLKVDCDSQVTHNYNTDMCFYGISSTKFNGNQATLSGGGYSTNLLTPLVSSPNTYINNQAVYGTGKAGYPVKIKIIGDALTQVKSGMVLSIKFGIYDQFGQIVNTDSTTQILASVSIGDQGKSRVMGSIDGIAVNGTVELKQLQIVADPGSISSFQFDANSISLAKNRLSVTNFSDGQETLKFNLKSIQCELGDKFVEQQCVTCPPTQYLLELNKSSCITTCPEGAECLGGSKIKVKQNYWRVSNISDQIFPCLSQEACTGGTACSTGYTGNLCQRCKSQGDTVYARLNQNDCLLCDSIGLNTAKIVGAVLFSGVYILFIVQQNMKVDMDDVEGEVLLRILTTYMQTASLSQALEMRWPFSVRQYFNTMSFASESTDKIISVECFVKTLFHRKGTDADRFDEFVLKMVLWLVSPIPAFFLGAVMAVVYLTVRCKLKTDFKKFLSLTFVVVLYVLYPIITNYSFSVFSCKTLTDDTSWVANDLQVKCYSGTHLLWIFTMGLPGLIIYVIGIPLVQYLIMFRFRKDLENPKHLIYYSFFYKGVREKVYYWEIVEILIKVVSISISIFIDNNILKAACVILLLAVKSSMIQRWQPYCVPSMNKVAFISSYASYMSIYFGIFFYQGINSIFIMLVTIALIVSNVVFLGYWSYLYYRTIHEKVEAFFAKLSKIRDKILNRQSSKVMDETSKGESPVSSDFVSQSGQITIKIRKSDNNLPRYDDTSRKLMEEDFKRYKSHEFDPTQVDLLNRDFTGIGLQDRMRATGRLAQLAPISNSPGIKMNHAFAFNNPSSLLPQSRLSAHDDFIQSKKSFGISDLCNQFEAEVDHIQFVDNKVDSVIKERNSQDEEEKSM